MSALIFVLVIFLMIAASAEDWPTRIAVFLFYCIGFACVLLV